MSLGNDSLMAILHELGAEPEPERREWAAYGLRYFYMLLTKVALNCFLVAFARCGLAHSLMDYFLLSLCVADFLLTAALGITAVLLGGNHGDGDVSFVALAFLLTHASCIYALLPLPVLALGAVDLWASAGQESARLHGAGGRVAAVLALWVAAGLYSAWCTDPSVLEVALMSSTRPDLELVLVCEVQASCQVSLFCLTLLVGVAIALLLHLPDVLRWTARLYRLAAAMEHPGNPDKADPEKTDLDKGDPDKGDPDSLHLQSDLPLSGVDAVPLPLPPRNPPLYASCALLLAMRWGPYLLLHLGCELLLLDVPSYASVNTLWLSCANSLLLALAYWGYRDGHRDGHQGVHQRSNFHAHCLDPICDWRIAGCLSYPGNHDPLDGVFGRQKNLPGSIA